jgi:hypothetical protein
VVRGAYGHGHGHGRYLRREVRRLKSGPELEPAPRGTVLPYGSFFFLVSLGLPFWPFAPFGLDLVIFFASVRAGKPSSMLPRM